MGKARKDYTISDMRRLDLSWLKKNSSPEVVSIMRNNIDYVTRLASDLGYSQFVGKKFLRVFPNDLHTYDKNDLNKLVVESMNNDRTMLATEEATPQLQYLETCKGENVFRDNRGDDIDERIEAIDGDIANATTRADSYYESFTNSMEQLANHNEKLQELEFLKENLDPDAQRTDIIESITDVIKAGDWIYLGTSLLGQKVDMYKSSYRLSDKSKAANRVGTSVFKGHLFISAAPIYCTYNNPAAGTHMSVNFGHIIVGLSDTGTIRHHSWCIDFMASAGTSHPHLSGTSICWGSGATAYKTLTSGTTVDFHRVLCLFKSLLENYCPDNPYRPLSRYNNMRNSRFEWADMSTELLSRIPSKLFGDSAGEVNEYIARVAKSEKYMNDVTANYRTIDTDSEAIAYLGWDLYKKILTPLYIGDENVCSSDEYLVEGTNIYSQIREQVSDLYYARESYYDAFIKLMNLMKEYVADNRLPAFTREEYLLLQHAGISDLFNDNERAFMFLWILASPEAIGNDKYIWGYRHGYSSPFRRVHADYTTNNNGRDYRLNGSSFRDVYVPIEKFKDELTTGSFVADRISAIDRCLVPSFGEEQ